MNRSQPFQAMSRGMAFSRDGLLQLLTDVWRQVEPDVPGGALGAAFHMSPQEIGEEPNVRDGRGQGIDLASDGRHSAGRGRARTQQATDARGDAG